ncbi:MAG: TatD family hydrolase [Bacteroidaceae bacterium]|nr:TatD family hydrolase [Bacteroidaceae bacterium]
MPEFIDTHTHLFVQEFNDDRNATVERALSAGVRTLCLPCIDESSIEPIREMCREYPGICHAMIGLHPTEVGDDYRSVLERMHATLKKNREFIAIGEVGLDFYWDDTRKREQTDALVQQIEWAAETGLPLAIHSRSAFDELYSVMESYRSRGLSGVFHCFSGSEEEAHKLLSFDGFCLGIGGVVTYRKSALPAVLASVPLERIVLETDSPYLPPVPYRGKRNESSYIPYIAHFLATLYGCSVERVAEVTTANAMRIFPKING